MRGGCCWAGAGTLAIMNACFYTAISRLPLATVSAIEFLPVIGLAALGARTLRNVIALPLAIAGVYLLTRVTINGAAIGFVLRSPTRCSLGLHRARRPCRQAT